MLSDCRLLQLHDLMDSKAGVLIYCRSRLIVSFT